MVFFVAMASAEQSIADNSYEFSSIEHLVEQEVGRLVLTQIYKNIGIDINITPLPANRAQYNAIHGHSAGEIMRIWSYGIENPTTIRVPTPYYYLETMPFVIKGKNVSINVPADLQRYKLAKVRGVKHTDNITQGLPKVYVTNSTEKMFKLLKSGRVDVVLTNTLDGNLVLKKLGYTNIIAMDKPLAVLPLYHYIFHKHKALVPLVDKEIIRLKSNGELEALIIQAEREVGLRH